MPVENAEIIADQYTSVVGCLDQMFTEMDQRSNAALWRWKDSPHTGVGSCKYGDYKNFAWDGLRGPAEDLLIELQNKRGEEILGSSSLTKCFFHRENLGCVLRELKSPLCISHVENAGELRKRFCIDGYQLTHDVLWVLDHILDAKDPATDKPLKDPKQNRWFTELACAAVAQMTNHIKRFPILHP